MAWRCCKAHTCDEGVSLHMRHDIESCDQGGENQDMTWLDTSVASVKGKLSDDLAPMDQSNGEEQVESRSMNRYQR
jgi:hypothetical protein